MAAPVVNLLDKQFFPTFDECPYDNDVDLSYLSSDDGTLYTPKKHWCLLAEIKEVEFLFRLRILAQDKEGNEFISFFYLDNDDSIDHTQFQPGRVMTIMYVDQHGFLDLTTGVRVETKSAVCCIPLPMQELLLLSDKINENHRLQTTSSSAGNACNTCGKVNRSVMKCTGCSLFFFCDKTCQTKAWNENNHRKECKALRKVGWWFGMDWNTFDKYRLF